MDFASDFKKILEGDFSVACIITSKASGEIYETRGIFDNTFEPVQTQEGGRILEKFARFVMFSDCPFAIKQFDSIVINGNTFKVKEVQEDSERNLVLWLKD